MLILINHPYRWVMQSLKDKMMAIHLLTTDKCAARWGKQQASTIHYQKCRTSSTHWINHIRPKNSFLKSLFSSSQGSLPYSGITSSRKTIEYFRRMLSTEPEYLYQKQVSLGSSSFCQWLLWQGVKSDLSWVNSLTRQMWILMVNFAEGMIMYIDDSGWRLLPPLPF